MRGLEAPVDGPGTPQGGSADGVLAGGSGDDDFSMQNAAPSDQPSRKSEAELGVPQGPDDFDAATEGSSGESRVGGIEATRELLEWVSPAGDIVDMTEGSKLISEGVRSGDWGKVGKGLSMLGGGALGTLTPGRPGKFAGKAADTLQDGVSKVKLPKVSKTQNPLSSKEFNKLPESGAVDPTRLRTMQNSIKRRFGAEEGPTLEQSIVEVQNGKSLPPIRIFEFDGKVYTLDHRRVVTYRAAGKPIPYRKATNQEIQAAMEKKLTSKTDGMEIKIRGVK